MLVPHRQQSRPGTCVQACVRMVLVSYGEAYSEAEVSKLLKSREFGTYAPNIKMLERIGYRVQYGPSTLEAIQRELGFGHHVIAFVLADFVSWTTFSDLHAVVVADLVSETEIAVQSQQTKRVTNYCCYVRGGGTYPNCG